MKTAELIGPALDWAVAKVEGHRPLWDESSERFFLWGDCDWAFLGEFSPSTNWAQGGPIIEKEKMDFKWVGINLCRASIEWLDERHVEAFGPTPLVAAMRCFVASKLDDDVEIPKELL